MTAVINAAGAASSLRETPADKIAELRSRRDQALQPASAPAAEKQRAAGKLTARQRVGLLLDAGSFVESGLLTRHRSTNLGADRKRPYGDGVITGYGTIHGRRVCVYAQDVTAAFGGSVGEVFGDKVAKIQDLALKTGCPIIAMNDSSGARIQEGVGALAAYGKVARRAAIASGVIPQIALIMGTCAGGAAYIPAGADFTIMVEGTSHMFVTGPDVVRSVTGEDVSLERLGGALMHATTSGAAHHVAADEAAAIEYVRALLCYLPASNAEDPPAREPAADLDPDEELDLLLPPSPRTGYDMHRVIERIVDDGTLLETQPLFARNIICALARIDGRSVGVVANQPQHLAGVLDIDSSEKAARFIRCCDAFNIPVLTLVDAPGFLPGSTQECRGIVRRGAKLGYAYIEATVPKVTVVIRKAFGGAYAAMGSKELGADINFAWPTAQIGVIGAESAVDLLFGRILAEADNREARRNSLVTQYEDMLISPYAAAELGVVDDIISPSQTRPAVVQALRALRNKRELLPSRKHGNMPL
jgi:propionyl-CoA carboxylase beta chain